MTAASGRRAYLLCATPRSGSTLLCGLLRSTGVAGRPESYFRRPDLQSWADRWQLPRRPDGRFEYRDFIRAAVAAGSTGNGVFAARIMWGSMEDLLGWLGAGSAAPAPDLLTEAFGPTHFVHLWRDDVLAQAVSRVRAEQTGYWQHGDDRSSLRTPRFDRGQIRAAVEEIVADNAAWRRWFAAYGIRPYDVRYEDVTRDMAGVTRGILRFLGLDLPAGVTIAPAANRQADELNAEWIRRYGAGGDR